MNADEQLRRLRDDDRWADDAPPRWVPARSPRTARARRPLLPFVATVFTAAVVIAVGATALLHGRSAPADDPAPVTTSSNPAAVIPWVATTPAATPSPSPSVGSAPACVLDQLTVRSRAGGTAMGSWRQAVTIRNRGSRACTLEASSVALQALSSGRFVTFGKTAVEGSSGRFILRPGRTAHFWASLSPCFADGRHFGDEVAVPMYLSVKGQRVPLNETVPNDFRPLCAHPDAASGASGFSQEGDVPDVVSPLAGLETTMDLPKVVRAGETVDYTVTLTNPTSKTVPFDPCPTYDQDYVDPGDGKQQLLVITRLVLNCGALRALEPGRSATFAMRTVIPNGAHGLAKISWSFDGDASVTSLRTVSGR